MMDSISLQFISRNLAFSKHNSAGGTASHHRTEGKLVLTPREARSSDYCRLSPVPEVQGGNTSMG